MNAELTPWRAVPVGATVFDSLGEPGEAGAWLGPDVTGAAGPGRWWRVVEGEPRLLDPDALVPMLAGEEGHVTRTFRDAGFAIEGVIACPPEH